MHDEAFQKKYLFPPEGEPINNKVGERSGESLLRTTEQPENEILERADRQPDSQGAAVAQVSDIRSITLAHDQSVRLFRIYEDPTPEDPGHAVIRFDVNHKPAWKIARGDLKQKFRKI